MNDEQEKIKLLTIKEAVDMVDGLTLYAVRKFLKNGTIPHIRNGKKILIPKEAFLEAMKFGSATTVNSKIDETVSDD